MLYSVLKKLNFDGKLIINDSSNKTHEIGSGKNHIKVKIRLTI